MVHAAPASTKVRSHLAEAPHPMHRVKTPLPHGYAKLIINHRATPSTNVKKTPEKKHPYARHRNSLRSMAHASRSDGRRVGPY